MDWYFRSDSEILAVPKDEETFDTLPSPDSWSLWGNVVGDFNSPEKLNVLDVEELLLSETTFCGAFGQLSPPSICQGSRHTFRQHSACPDEHSDVQLNDLPIIDEADDIFFRSLFEVNARALEGADCSADSTQTSNEDDSMAVVDTAENAARFLPEKESEVKNCVLEEQSNLHEDISNENMPMEESVLLELQRLTVQLAKKTRICFRDSLYRLAENSRYQPRCSRNGKEDLKNCKQTTGVGQSRSGQSKSKNSDTNAIDRTVATLLFDTMKLHNPTAASTSGLNAGTLQREYQAKSRSYRPSSSISSLCTVQASDAEVPTCGFSNQPLPPPRGHNPFSTTPPMWS